MPNGALTLVFSFRKDSELRSGGGLLPPAHRAPPPRRPARSGGCAGPRTRRGPYSPIRWSL